MLVSEPGPPGSTLCPLFISSLTMGHFLSSHWDNSLHQQEQNGFTMSDPAYCLALDHHRLFSPHPFLPLVHCSGHAGKAHNLSWASD